MQKNKLELELSRAGLPTDPGQIIGRTFKFEYASPGGSPDQIIVVGTVLSLEIVGELGLKIYVSSPMIFSGKGLSSIRHAAEWQISCDDRDDDGFHLPNYLSGKFQLL